MKRAKRNLRPSWVVHLTHEPDYDHPAWEAEGPAPTWETNPDAFYTTSEPAWPKAPKVVTRREPHKHLSRAQLRKRLYQAGLRGAELNRIATAIKAGPGLLEGVVPGVFALGWNVDKLYQQFGQRVARAVLRFVRHSLIVMDEAWQLLN